MTFIAKHRVEFGYCLIQAPLFDMASPLGFGGHSHKVEPCTLLVYPSLGLFWEWPHCWGNLFYHDFLNAQ